MNRKELFMSELKDLCGKYKASIKATDDGVHFCGESYGSPMLIIEFEYDSKDVGEFEDYEDTYFDKDTRIEE